MMPPQNSNVYSKTVIFKTMFYWHKVDTLTNEKGQKQIHTYEK